MINSCVSTHPHLSAVPEEIELATCSGVFPSCAITQAMAQKSTQNRGNSMLNDTHDGDDHNSTVTPLIANEHGLESTDTTIEGTGDMPEIAGGSPVLTRD